MRYDTPVYFRRIIHGEYDAKTGDYKPDTTEEVMQYASVTSTGISTNTLVYGDLKQGSLTIRLQNHFSKPFDNIRIGEGEDAKIYRVDMEFPHRLKQSFVVSEVHGHGPKND